MLDQGRYPPIPLDLTGRGVSPLMSPMRAQDRIETFPRLAAGWRAYPLRVIPDVGRAPGRAVGRPTWLGARCMDGRARPASGTPRAIVAEVANNASPHANVAVNVFIGLTPSRKKASHVPLRPPQSFVLAYVLSPWFTRCFPTSCAPMPSFLGRSIPASSPAPDTLTSTPGGLR